MITRPAFGPSLPGLDAAPAQWAEINKGHRSLIAFADRHYTRQTAGSNQCCRPGVNFCLLLSDATAAWVVWRPIPEVGRLDDLEAWECTMFRNEGPRLSSDLITEATALTYRSWGWPPRDGLITSVGIEETAKRRSRRGGAGACFVHAGWTRLDERGGKAWLAAPRPARVRKAAS